MAPRRRGRPRAGTVAGLGGLVGASVWGSGAAWDLLNAIRMLVLSPIVITGLARRGSVIVVWPGRRNPPGKVFPEFLAVTTHRETGTRFVDREWCPERGPFTAKVFHRICVASDWVKDMLKQFLSFVLGLCLVTALTGCTMCFTPYDDHYNAYGGVVERQDRVRGRVGSILSDPSLQYTEGTGMFDEGTQEDLYPMEMEQPRIEPPSGEPRSAEPPSGEPPNAEPLPPPQPEPESPAKADPETDAGTEPGNDDVPNEAY